jgi:hypothetical protein
MTEGREFSPPLSAPTNSPTVADAADAAPGMMKMASDLVDSGVGGGPEAFRSTGASSSPNSLARTSPGTGYYRPPTAGEHVEQNISHSDVPRRPLPVVCRC